MQWTGWITKQHKHTSHGIATAQQTLGECLIELVGY
jgi:hypothetical protein